MPPGVRLTDGRLELLRAVQLDLCWGGRSLDEAGAEESFVAAWSGRNC
jgi:hypothetical protein